MSQSVWLKPENHHAPLKATDKGGQSETRRRIYQSARTDGLPDCSCKYNVIGHKLDDVLNHEQLAQGSALNTASSMAAGQPVSFTSIGRQTYQFNRRAIRHRTRLNRQGILVLRDRHPGRSPVPPGPADGTWYDEMIGPGNPFAGPCRPGRERLAR